MARAGVWLLVTSCALTAACGQGFAPYTDSPFAPGVARNEQAVDGLLVGNRLLDAREFELAIDAFSRAALVHGMTADVLAGLGAANLGLGRLHTAERLLRDAVDKDETSPEIWNNLGVVLLERGDFGEAELVFKKAYALDNGQSNSIRDNLRLVLAKSENSDYDIRQEQDYKLIRRGSSDYIIRTISE